MHMNISSVLNYIHVEQEFQYRLVYKVTRIVRYSCNATDKKRKTTTLYLL